MPHLRLSRSGFLQQNTDSDTEIIITTVDQAIAGGLSAFASRFVNQPLDVIKIRLQLKRESLKGSNKTRYFRFLLDTFPMIYNKYGIRGFWRGHNTAQLIAVPMGASQFWIFAESTRLLNLTSLKDSYLRQYVAAFLTGTVHLFVFTPLEIFKTLIISQDVVKDRLSMISTIRKMAKQEGVQGIYKGAMASNISLAMKLTLFGLMSHIAMGPFQEQEDISDNVMMMMSGVSAALTTLIIYPLEVIKRRRQVCKMYRVPHKATAEVPCRRIIQCGKTTFQQEGFLALYKGIEPSLVKALLSAFVTYSVYEATMNCLEESE